MNRRQAIALTAEERDEMLRTSYTIILSSIDHRGYPHSVPMWYVVHDGCVLMTTYAKAQKAVNLRRNPRCSLLLEAGTQYNELRGILIRGRAELISDVDMVLEVLADIRRKQGILVSAEEIAEALRAHAAKRVLIKVVPERTSSWDHRKLGSVY
jgi:nitroimidazol reductase NimA-like FMN-containing flavoprotein (pyridoxamine 5'-phosphate oxidase superfamily)